MNSIIYQNLKQDINICNLILHLMNINFQNLEVDYTR